MAHVTFYRKYRSKTFDEIVGQRHVIQTLKNAIDHDRLSQAYIFSGPRGTGKTSTARILAKVLNCTDFESPLCKRIEAGQCVDVIELDAASHTGVDHMRVLTEQASFSPVECDYRLFIIDEAHMLSTGAFNALLKTLEEPPQRIIFILATTEPYKIPVTIHSRCQHLHFKRLTLAEIQHQLSHIIAEEGITIDDMSLKSIARNADGCMRDGISLLDQLYSFCGDTITFDDTLLMLGATSSEHILELLKLFLNGDKTAVIKHLDALFQEGINMVQFISELTLLFRDLLFIKMGIRDVIEREESVIADMTLLADHVSVSQCRLYVEALAKSESQARWFPHPELLLQVTLLTMIDGETVIEQPGNAAKPESKPELKVESAAKAVPTESAPSKPAPPSKPVEQAVPAMPKVDASVDPADESLWTRCLESISKEDPGLYFILKDSRLAEKTNNNVIVRLKQEFKFARKKLLEEPNVKKINDVVGEIFGNGMRFQLFGNSTSSGGVSSTGADFDSAQESTQDSGSKKINMIVSMFEGKVV